MVRPLLAERDGQEYLKNSNIKPQVGELNPARLPNAPRDAGFPGVETTACHKVPAHHDGQGVVTSPFEI